MASLGDMVVRITGDNSQFDAAINKSKTGVDNFLEAAGKIGTKLSIFVTAPLIAAGVAALKSAGQFQMYQASFETMLGSAARAKILIDDLQKLAAATPFKMEDLAQGAQTLLQYGITVDDLLPTIKSLGDVAQGNSERFNALARAFGQTQSTGRLLGQDLLQMINAGFNPLKVIAQQTGRSMGDLKASMEKGAISAGMVADAFKVATSEGGMFFNGMEKASKTLPGLMSTLSDDVGTLGRSFATILMPAAMDAVKSLSNLAKSFTELDDGTKKAILAGAGVLAVAGPLLVIIPKITLAIRAMAAGVATSTGVIGIAIITVGLLVAGIVKLVAASREAKEQQALLDGAIKGTLTTTAEYQQALDIEIAKRTQANETLQKGIENWKTMGDTGKMYIAQGQNIIKQLDAEIVAITKNRNIRAAADKKAEDAAKARLAAEIAAAIAEQQAAAEAVEADKERVKSEGETVGKLIEWSDTYQAAIKEEADANLKEWKDAEAARVANAKDTVARLIAFSDENQKTIEDEAEANLKVQKDANDELERDRKEKHDAEVARQNEIANLVISASKSIAEAVGTDLAAGKLTWKSFGEAALDAIGAIVSAIGDQLAASAAADVILAIAAAASVIGAGAAPGYFASAAIKASGALAAWAAGAALKAIELPVLAEGGIIPARPGGTLAMVAEAGQSEAIIPLNQLDRMLSQAGAGAGGDAGNIHLVVRIDSKPILDTIFAATRNRTVLIDGRAIVT